MTENSPKACIEVMREAIRQGEVMLSAQLQARLALEGRAVSSMAWLITSLIAILGAVYSLNGIISQNFHNLLIVLLTIISFATIYNVLAVISSGEWYYVGINPSDVIKYISVSNRPLSWSSRVLQRLRNGKFGRGRVKAIQTAHSFEDDDLSLDHVLHKTAVRYASNIVHNEGQLRSIKMLVNLPATIILLGIVAIMLFVALTNVQFYPSKPTDSPSVAPLLSDHSP